MGLGGAGFPTHVKLTPKDENAIDYVISKRSGVRALSDQRLPSDGRGAGEVSRRLKGHPSAL